MKSIEIRINDLRRNAVLLQEACQRFFSEHRHDEVLNIGVRLRVLVGSGKGSGLLLELAQEKGEKLSVLTLNAYGVLKLAEVENETGRIIQEVEKKAIFTQMPGRLPIVFPENEYGLYARRDLAAWLEEGFLIDWDVPDGKGGSKVARFTPQALINRYAGQEAAHSDPTHGKFGSPVESVTMHYNIEGKQIVVPVVYEYLAQIGVVVAHVATEFANKHLSPQD
jgi:hypothetical protein